MDLLADSGRGIRMDNLGSWTTLSLPPFIVIISSLKGQFQNISLWVYL